MDCVQILAGNRPRLPLKKILCTIVGFAMGIMFLICTSIYPPRHSLACMFSSRGCYMDSDWRPARVHTDEELASLVVTTDILKTPSLKTKNPKIAFMFLSPASLPFEKLWDKFFRGHEGRFTVYVHASKEKPMHVSHFFHDRDIGSDQVEWGKFSMVDAERRLVADALQDADNQHFVLLSDSCVPLHTFDYVYDYLMHTNISYVDCFLDPGQHGNGRYSEKMLPEVEKSGFRKGAQWFTMKRQHALILLADSLYYSKFRDHCQPGLDGKDCIADEHYIPTFLNMVDPGGIATWSVTHVGWSKRKSHPKSYRAQDVTYALLKNITSIDVSVHVTSDSKPEEQVKPCLWNGVKRPCYLFARKFHPAVALHFEGGVNLNMAVAESQPCLNGLVSNWSVGSTTSQFWVRHCSREDL